MNTEKYGMGIEMEGFIMKEGSAKELIEDIPSSEWILRKILNEKLNLEQYISFEQASVMLEVKSDVFENEREAIAQILEIRNDINKILNRKGCELMFQPVLERDFDFIPATSNKDSRVYQLIEEWGNTEKGKKLLKDTVIASLQINDSRPFQNANSLDKKLELAFKIHNLYSKYFEELNKFNGKIKDFDGKTRIEKITNLLVEVKKEVFAKYGINDPLKALLPGEFTDIEEMKNWMKAHSDVDNFEDTNCKNEHALTVKIKRDQAIWICESRLFDAVNTESEIEEIIKKNNDLLSKI